MQRKRLGLSPLITALRIDQALLAATITVLTKIETKGVDSAMATGTVVVLRRGTTVVSAPILVRGAPAAGPAPTSTVALAES